MFTGDSFEDRAVVQFPAFICRGPTVSIQRLVDVGISVEKPVSSRKSGESGSLDFGTNDIYASIGEQSTTAPGKFGINGVDSTDNSVLGAGQKVSPPTGTPFGNLDHARALSPQSPNGNLPKDSFKGSSATAPAETPQPKNPVGFGMSEAESNRDAEILQSLTSLYPKAPSPTDFPVKAVQPIDIGPATLLARKAHLDMI